jgi:hypothetical protein
MTGYSTYTRWQRIEAQAKTLGFRLGNPKNGRWGIVPDAIDTVALYPDNDALPVFSRDADIFEGTFSQVETFLTGWARAQQYDAMLRMTDEKKRKKYEDKERERQRLAAERLEKRKMFAALADKTEDEVDRLVK